MTTIKINRQGGLGDVAMALCAAHAIHENGYGVELVTHPDYHLLASACPFVSRVSSGGGGADLNPAKYGLAPIHQVDAYLADLGFMEPDSNKKTLCITHSTQLVADISNRVLLHPGVGDANRTWPIEKWAELARRLRESGRYVALIGKRVDESGKGALVLRGYDTHWNLDHVNLMNLMENFGVFVSTDSGPIQLAGATNCSVVGIYSVVRGNNRLPYRSTLSRGKNYEVSCACPEHPCYQKMHNEALWALRGAPALKAGQSLNQVFSEWCVNANDTYGCMHNLSVEAVHAVINKALSPLT